MNILVLPTNEIKPEYIYFLDSKNNILMDGIFTKIIYTNEWFVMNGLYINLPIEIQGVDTNHYKQTIFFSVSQYSTLLHQLDLLEQHILSKYIPTESTKHKSFLLIQSLKLGFFRIFKGEKNVFPTKNTTNTKKKIGFILKISGIWENANEYGLSYKIMDATSCLVE
jgi:hypothetical protein